MNRSRLSNTLLLGGAFTMMAMTPQQTSAEGVARVTLTGQVSTNDDRLEVDYRLANDGTVPVYVWDLMVDYTHDRQVINPDLAYVFWEEPNTVRIVRAVLDIPPDFDITKKEVPYVRRLAPGMAAAGHIVLHLPCKEYSPFYPATSNVRERTAKRVRLLIGWIEEQVGMSPTPRSVNGREVLALKGAWRGAVQRLAEQMLDGTVKVLQRQDKFDRRLPM